MHVHEGGYSITPTTHLSVFSYFPITGDIVQETFTMGFKQQLWVNENKQLFIALSGAYNLKNEIFMLSAHVSYYNESQTLGIHGSLSTYRRSISWSDFDTQLLNFGFGLEYKKTKKFSIIAEYQQLSIAKFDLEDLPGLASIGFRWKGEDLAIDFAGMRPVDAGVDSDLIFFPFIKGTIIF